MFFFLFASFSTSEFVDSRQIRGKIEAEWNETPILAECASFLQDIDHRIYWDFLDQISTIKSKVVTIEDAISVMKDFLDPEQINILNISLQISFFLPYIIHVMPQFVKTAFIFIITAVSRFETRHWGFFHPLRGDIGR